MEKTVKNLKASSMTGFGRAQSSSSRLNLEVEIRAVNSRYLDLAFRLPREYGIFEPELRELLGTALRRGRIELSVSRKAAGPLSEELQFNRTVYDRLSGIYSRMLAGRGGPSEELRQRIAFEILGRKEVLGVAEESVDPSREKAQLFEAAQKALLALKTMRICEGRKLIRDLSLRCSRLGRLLAQVKRRTRRAPEILKARLLSRISRLSPEVQLDPGRLSAEVALLADRVDITEETVRLGSHLEELALELRSAGNGRKLDFLLQEIGREFNTVGAKAQDAEVQKAVVQAKVEMEKMREQIQNLE